MRYLEVTERDGYYAARLAEGEEPRPKAGEVTVRVVASGVNRADLSQIAGKYPPPPGESSILGLEISGTVATTGEKVCAILAGGGHAEIVAAPEGQIFPPPRATGLIRVLMSKRARLIGSTLRSRSRDEKARIVRRFREEVLPAFDTRRLNVSIDSVYPPEEAGAAFTRMRENRNTGKILLDWTRGAVRSLSG